MNHYEVTYTEPFKKHAETDRGGSLKPLLKKVRARIAQSIHGAQAQVELSDGRERWTVAIYQNKNGKLKKVK